MRGPLKIFLVTMIFVLGLAQLSPAMDEGQIKSMVTRSISDYVLKKHPDYSGSQVKVTFEYAESTFKALTKRSGKVTFAVTENYPDFDPLGDVIVPLQVYVDGVQAEKVSIRANVQIWMDIVVASKKIDKLQVLTGDNIKLSKKNVGVLPQRFFLDVNDVLGKQIVSSLSSGTVILDWMVRSLPMISKGEDVMITAKNGALTVTARGTALQDGYCGDKIKVKNSDTKKEIKAIVVSTGEVLVNLK